jgi:23S rRNA pseudouridine1911/1915/1917 synthase
MAAIGHPVVGDPKYGSVPTGVSIKGQALHSAEIHFRHPRTGEEMSFSAEIPRDMQNLIEQLKKRR